MSTVPGDVAPHPVAALAARARERFEQVTAPGTRPVWAMTPTEQRTALLDLVALENEVAGLKLQVLAEADRGDTCTSEGDRTAADWLARHTHQRRPHARADLHLAHALDDRHHQVKTAMALGRVNPDQAHVITRALDDLPTTGPEAITTDQLVSAEAFLVDKARHHDAKDLAILGKRLHEVIAPDQAEAREGRALEAEERRAAQHVSFTMRTDDRGVCHGRFRISKLHGAMLEKALQAFMSPARPTTEPDPSVEPVETTDPLLPAFQRPYATRRGEAFTELIETLTAHDLPTLGGGDATVVVTMTLDQLLADLDHAGVATLDTGDHISAALARQLACRHRLIPAVLGGRSEVLDLGRARRLHTRPQRMAMTLTQHGCTTEHCDIPAALCHAHHDHPWSHGGPTDLANGRLLCPHHHRRTHDPAYETRHLPDGKVAFHRRE